MSDDFWGDASLGTGSWDDAASSWGPSFDYSVEPAFDEYATDWSSVFSNPDFVSSNFGSEPYDWSSDINWSDAFADSNYFGADYDPLTDPNASVGDTLEYFDKYFTNPNLYSLGNDGGFGAQSPTSKLGIGEALLSLSGDNELGRLLSQDPVADESSGKSLKDTINKLLKMLGGEARSPLGQLAQGLLAAATKRKDVKNQVITRNDARDYAKAESQGALAGRRTGLPNFSGEVRDPYSYVQPAPLIER